jgi:hypothetical protein
MADAAKLNACGRAAQCVIPNKAAAATVTSTRSMTTPRLIRKPGDGRQYCNGIKAGPFVDGSKNQLTEPLVCEKGPTVRRMRKEVLPDETVALEHDLADGDVSRQVAIPIEQHHRRGGDLQPGEACKDDIRDRWNQEGAAATLAVTLCRRRNAHHSVLIAPFRGECNGPQPRTISADLRSSAIVHPESRIRYKRTICPEICPN